MTQSFRRTSDRPWRQSKVSRVSPFTQPTPKAVFSVAASRPVHLPSDPLGGFPRKLFRRPRQSLRFSLHDRRRREKIRPPVIAWAKCKAAVLFVFPHSEELSIYGARIEDTLLANPSTPDRVLKYDRRVRTRVAESPRIRLSDVSAFFPDYAYFNLTTGTIGTLGALRDPGQAWCGRRERSPEVCRRFNFTSCHDMGACGLNSNKVRATRACVFYAVFALLAILPTFNL